MTNKEIYRKVCEREKSIPVFSQYWWMETVCQDTGWDVFLVGNGMDVKAVMPYSLRTDEKGKYIGRISLTQNNGIWIKYPAGQGIIARQSYEEKIINEVCDFIESLGLVSYDQQYHYNFTNYLPFFWRFYTETTKYTYVIEDTSDMEKVRSGYSSKLKNVLRKANKYLKVDEMEDPEEFYKVNRMSFERQEIDIPYSYRYFERIWHSCQRENKGKLICAKDEHGNIQSVAMLVWDAMSVYYLLNGTNPALKAFQGNDLLIDHAIEVAHSLHLKFDFEGSVIRNVNHAFREFGGLPMPYFRIQKNYK